MSAGYELVGALLGIKWASRRSRKRRRKAARRQAMLSGRALQRDERGCYAGSRPGGSRPSGRSGRTARR